MTHADRVQIAYGFGYEAFPGLPTLHEGMIHANDKPGLGIDFDETAADRFTPDERDADWTEARLHDGTLHRP